MSVARLTSSLSLVCLFSLGCGGPADRTPPQLTPENELSPGVEPPSETTLLSGPDAYATESEARFTFNGPKESYECRLDEGDWEPCESPATYSDLDEGARVFGLRGVDAQGSAEAEPVYWYWAVDTTPDGVLGTAPKRFYFDVEEHSVWLPYAANRPVDRNADDITRLLIAIHGTSYSAWQFLENGVLAAEDADKLDETLVVAPQILRADEVEEIVDDEMLYWAGFPFWGSQRAYLGSEPVELQISAFEALDRLLIDFASTTRFPNLDEVVVFGHSGGGQFSNRYATANPVDLPGERPTGVNLRYVVSAPSSFVYFDDRRYDADSGSFVVPENAPEDYNEYGFGLDELYAYLADQADADEFRQRYDQRTVYYLVGSDDNDPHDETLSTSPGAVMQGDHRVERMERYYDHLADHFGSQIYNRQHMAIVPDATHWGQRIMRSDEGLEALFGTP